MKTIFTLLAFLFMSISVFAAARPSSVITVKSADKTDIRVILDGKRFEPHDDGIMFGSMEPGRHSIKIYKQRRNGWFSIAGGSYEMVYNTTIDLKRRTHLFITVERNGRISMQESKLKRTSDRDRDYNRDKEYSGQWGDHDSHEGYAGAMSDRELRQVLSSISSEWLESNKFKSADHIVKNNTLSTAQVEQILLLFNFENNKLELAKSAYLNTVDKKNYPMLFDVFSYSSSKSELERYIDSCK
jgi:hypothetical protein